MIVSARGMGLKPERVEGTYQVTRAETCVSLPNLSTQAANYGSMVMDNPEQSPVENVGRA